MSRLPRCHSCGRRAGSKAGSCPRCGVPQVGLCECGATFSVYAESCAGCGEAQIPQKYRRPRMPGKLKLGIILVLIAGAVVAAYIGINRDPLEEQSLRRTAILREVSRKNWDRARLLSHNYLEDYGNDPRIRMCLGIACVSLDPPRLAEAEAALEKAVRDRPDLDRARRELARLHYVKREHDIALELLEPLLDRTRPDRSAEWIAGLIRALEQDYRDIRLALEHLRAAVRGGGAGFDRLRLLAEVSISAMRESSAEDANVEFGPDIEAARTVARERLAGGEAGPDQLPDLLGFLARCEFALGAPREAYAALRRIGDLSGPDRLLLARVLLALGDRPRAVEILTALAETEQTAETLLRAVGFARSTGLLDAVPALALAARSQHPEDPEVCAARARSLLDTGDAAGAETEAGRLLGAHPRHVGLLLATADALLAQEGRESEGERLLLKNAERLGAGSILWLRLAELYIEGTPLDARADERLREVELWLLDEHPPRGGDSPEASAWAGLIRGRLHLRRRRFRMAVVELQRAVGRRPGDAKALFLLAQAYRGAGRPTREEIALSGVVGMLGASPPLLRLRADARMRTGDLAGAERDCRLILADLPEDPEALRTLGRVKLASDDRDLQEAADSLRRAAEQPSAGPFVRLELAEALRRLGREKEAEAEIRTTLERADGRAGKRGVADYLAQLVSVDGGVPFRDRAADLYEELLKEREEEVPTILRLAVLRIQQGRTEESAALARKALGLRPDSVAARRILYEGLLAGRRPGENALSRAEELSAEVDELAPESFHALYMAGRLALLRGRHAEAVERLESASAVNPGDRAATYFLATALFLSERFDDARDQLRQLGSVGDYGFETRRLRSAVETELARARLRGGNAASATALLREVLEREPGLRPARLLLARAYFAGAVAGNPRELERARTAAQDLVRDMEAAKVPIPEEELARAHILLGDICFAQGDLDALIAPCEAHRLLRPDDPIPFVRLAMARLAREEPELAAQEIAAAVALAPEAFGFRALQAQVLTAGDEAGLALDLIDAWLREHPDHPPGLSVRGRLLEILERGSEAEAAYRACLSGDPDQLYALSGLFSILERAGRWSDAIEFLREFLPRTTLKGDAKVLLARSLIGADPASGEAERLLVEAHRDGIADPLYEADSCLLLVRALTATGDHVRAARVGERFELLRLRNSELFRAGDSARLCAEVLFRSGLANEALHEPERAKQQYRAAIEADPGNVAALNNLAVLLGKRMATVNDAIELAEKATSAGPGVSEVWDTLAGLYLLRGDAVPAADAAEKAVELLRKRRSADPAAPEDDRGRAKLARYLMNLAQARHEAARPGAKAALEEAAELQPPIRETDRFLRLEKKLR